MSDRQEAKAVRRRLKGSILRAQDLAARCIEQANDQTLPKVDRESARTRARLAIESSESLQASLERIEEALDG